MAAILVFFMSIAILSSSLTTPVPQLDIYVGEGIDLGTLDLEAYRQRPNENGLRVVQPCFELKEGLSAGFSINNDLRIRDDIYASDTTRLKVYNITALKEQCAALGSDYANRRFIFNGSNYQPVRPEPKRIQLLGNVLLNVRQRSDPGRYRQG